MKGKIIKILWDFYGKANALLNSNMCETESYLKGQSRHIESQAVKELAQLIPQWIPVSEELPEGNGPVLGFTFEKRVTMVELNPDNSWVWGSIITHWMYLPELPK